MGEPLGEEPARIINDSRIGIPAAVEIIYQPRQRDVAPVQCLQRRLQLRPDQLDTDSLPPYDILDAVLQEYIEQDRTVDEIAALGYDRSLVCRIARMVDRNEYKRRQAPPGVKITRKGFGRDRRLPITNRYLSQ